MNRSEGWDPAQGRLHQPQGLTTQGTMPNRGKLYVRKDANQSDWARRQFLAATTTHPELQKVFVRPLWENVRPVFLDWIKLRERAEAGEPVRAEFPTSDGSPLLLAAEDRITSHRKLWGIVKAADADGAWPDVIPLRKALGLWAQSIHLPSEEWVMRAALNLVWAWWKQDSVEPDVDFELSFGHADEADWPPDTGRFEFQDPGWLPWLHSAEAYREAIEQEFSERLKTYLHKAEQTMRDNGYIPIRFDWQHEALVWFGLHHCGGRTYSQISGLCKQHYSEPAIAKGVQQIRKALGVPQRRTARGPDRGTRRAKAK